jgi:TonB family protein
VVAVHALETDPELDLDFVTAELARGQTLASVLAQRGKPPIALGLRLLGDAAEGLAAGHRAGLVHRDLRPASLYLVRSEAERQVRVKVAGFGIPQLIRRESLAAAPPEVSAYASPEMLANGSTRLTPASDVFSLGAIGFELMTGAPPLDEAARRALAEGRPVEIDAPREAPPAVPPHVFEAVLQALRIAPAERFADAGAFADALRQPAARPSVAVPAAIPTPAVAVPAPPVEAALAEAAPESDAAPAESRDDAAAAAVAPEAAAVPQAPTVPAEAAPRVAPAPSAVQPTRGAPMPRAVPADLELYYPPQRTATPEASSHPAEAPAAPVAAQTSVPAAPPVETATAPDESDRVPSTVAAAAAVAAIPAVAAAAPPAAVAKPAIAPRPVSIGGGARRKPVGAGARSVRGPAMAAGFVLGMLVLGTVGWMATHTTGADAASPEKQAANRLASGAPAASAPTAAVPGAEPQAAAATPAADSAAGPAEARRRALEEAKKRQQDEARKKQQEEQARLALLQQQQAAAAAAQAAPQQPATRPQAATPPPVQQPVAVVQRPAPPAAPPPAPPPAAAPAREEPAPAREAAPNEVFSSGEVEERPRLSNGGEIQRALQMRYPDQLAGARVSGAVMATFVVNADGRIDGSSIRIVSSPNPAFNVPTQNVLRRARFRPATVGGRPVRVQVTMPVQWTAPQ